jgi:phospholipid-binding lipoprotein MlaA
MRAQSMNLRALRRTFSGPFMMLALIVSGCATNPQNPQQGAVIDEDFHDPFEDTNRKIFEFNQIVDHHVLVPVAKAYRAALPQPIRNSLRDFLINLQEPLIFANDTLQGDFARAKDSIARFVLNSTIGMGGLVDVAGRWGIPYHEQDLGITLGVWGIPEGPYLVVPILGPSDARDLGGEVAEGFADPWNILAADNNLLWVSFLRGGVNGIDQRARYLDTLADIERTSLDYYATIRSLYRQRRAALIRHERKNLPPNPGFAQGSPAPPTVAMSQAPMAAVISAAQIGSEVSRQ